MADIVLKLGESIPADTSFTYRDMGDGTHAEVVYNGAPASGDYAQLVTVAISGGDFTSIKSANDSILDASSTKRYAVKVYPGNYTEAPITLKNYVDVISEGSNFSTKITASDPNTALFTGSGLNLVRGFIVNGITNNAAFLVDTASYAMTVSQCTIYNCKYGIQATDGLVTADRITTAPLGSMTSMFYANGGDIQVDGCSIQGNATITTYAHVDAGADLHVSMFSFYAPNVTTVFLAEGGSELETVGGFIKSATTAYKVDGASTVITGNVIVSDDVATHFEIVDLLSTVQITSGKMNRDNMNIVAGYQDGIFAFVDNKEADEGFAIWGELAVGRPERGKESVFGGGDSYTRGMIVYTYNPSGAVWTDVSTAAQSASGSTFTFPATAQNNAIYVASSLQDASDYLQYYGIKASINTALVPGAGSIVAEYWTGAAWVAIEHMSTKSNSPYTQYADHIFERAQSEQIRYPIAFLSSQAKTDPMTYGTALFWIRFRIATAVTTVPVFEQFKLHTSRFEVNEDGVTEYFGNGRYPRELEIHQRLTDDLQGASPGSQAINYASGITLTLVDNRFSDNTIDGFGGVLPIPIGLDTSIPIVFSLGWIPSVNTAGNVELEMDVAQTQVGDTLDGTLSTVNTPVVVPINAQQDEFIITQFSITVDEVVPGEFISYKTFRDATGGNIHDTLSGNAEIVSWSAYGYFWRP